jgi:glycosyltransferase involved in cell wall biosynthesis
MISKYPPIEGGVSSKTYWTAKALGERGHEVHIVTNALEVEEEYREEFDLSDPNYQPKNVFVHSTDPAPTFEANPSHIPFSKMYCEKLASLAIKVIEDYNIELIDSRYLVPYCVAGYIAKTMTGIPQIVSHAGSDLQRLYPSPYLKTLLEKTLKQADRIITNPEATKFFNTLGIPATKISELSQVYVDTIAFNPQVEPYDLKQHITNQKYPPEIPVMTYVGKITHHFETKGLPELLKACSKINKEFLLLFVANGNKLKEFKALIKKKRLTEKTLFLPFLPPWKMPSILKACTCLVALENSSSPVLNYHVSTVPAEAIAVGKSILISKEIQEKEPFRELGNSSVFVVDSRSVYKIKETLEKLMVNNTTTAIRRANADNALFRERFEHSIKETIRIYESTLKEPAYLAT